MAEIDDLVGSIGGLSKEIQNLTNSIRTLGPGLSQLNVVMISTTAAYNQGTSAINQNTNSLQNNQKQIGQTSDALGGLGGKVGSLFSAVGMFGGALKGLSGIMNLPIASMNAMGAAFNSATKSVAGLDQGIYKTSNLLRVSSTSFGDLTKAQSNYRKTLEDIQKHTNLTTIQSEKMFSSMMKGHKGMKDPGVVKNYAEIAKSVASLGGNFEDTQVIVQNLMGTMQKFKEFENAVTAVSKGQDIKTKDAAAIAIQMSKGNIDLDQIRDMAAIQDKKRRNPTKDDNRGNSEVASLQFAKEKDMAQAQWEVDKVTANSKYVKELMKLTSSTAKLIQGNAGLVSGFQQASYGANLLGTALIALAGIVATKKLAGSVLSGGGASAAAGAAGAAGAGSAAAKTGVLASLAGFLGFKKKTPDITPDPSLGGPVPNAAKAGIGTKMMGGLKSSGAFAAVGGAAMGYAQYVSDKSEGYKDAGKRGISTGIGTTVGAIAGGVLGSIIGPIGTVIGSSVGGALGSWGAKWFNDKFYGEKEERPDYAKDSDDIKEDKIPVPEASNPADIDRSKYGTAYNDSSMKGLLKLGVDLQEVEKRVGSTRIELAATLEASSGLSSALSGVQGYGAQAAAALKTHSDALMQEAELIKQSAGPLRQFGEDQLALANAMSEATPEDALKKQSAIADANTVLAQARNAESQAIQKQVQAMQEAVRSRTMALDQDIEMQGSLSDLAKAKKDLNTEVRMGIGQSYEDTMAVIQNLASESKLMKSRAVMQKQMAAEYAASGDYAAAKYANSLAIKSETEAVRKEKDVYAEAKAMREGYLSAFKEELSSNAGSYAELAPTQTRGVQNFTNSVSLGGHVEGGSSIKTPGKYTTGGLQMDIGAYQKVQESILGGAFVPQSVQDIMSSGANLTGSPEDISALREEMTKNMGNMGFGTAGGGDFQNNSLKSLEKKAYETTLKRGTKTDPMYVLPAKDKMAGGSSEFAQNPEYGANGFPGVGYKPSQSNTIGGGSGAGGTGSGGFGGGGDANTDYGTKMKMLEAALSNAAKSFGGNSAQIDLEKKKLMSQFTSLSRGGTLSGVSGSLMVTDKEAQAAIEMDRVTRGYPANPGAVAGAAVAGAAVPAPGQAGAAPPVGIAAVPVGAAVSAVASPNDEKAAFRKKWADAGKQASNSVSWDKNSQGLAWSDEKDGAKRSDAVEAEQERLVSEQIKSEWMQKNAGIPDFDEKLQEMEQGLPKHISEMKQTAWGGTMDSLEKSYTPYQVFPSQQVAETVGAVSTPSTIAPVPAAASSASAPPSPEAPASSNKLFWTRKNVVGSYYDKKDAEGEEAWHIEQRDKRWEEYQKAIAKYGTKGNSVIGGAPESKLSIQDQYEKQYYPEIDKARKEYFKLTSHIPAPVKIKTQKQTEASMKEYIEELGKKAQEPFSSTGSSQIYDSKYDEYTKIEKDEEKKKQYKIEDYEAIEKQASGTTVTEDAKLWSEIDKTRTAARTQLGINEDDTGYPKDLLISKSDPAEELKRRQKLSWAIEEKHKNKKGIDSSAAITEINRQKDPYLTGKQMPVAKASVEPQVDIAKPTNGIINTVRAGMNYVTAAPKLEKLKPLGADGKPRQLTYDDFSPLIKQEETKFNGIKGKGEQPLVTGDLFKDMTAKYFNSGGNMSSKEVRSMVHSQATNAGMNSGDEQALLKAAAQALLGVAAKYDAQVKGATSNSNR